MKYLFGFHYAVVLSSPKGSETEHYTLLHHEGSKQMSLNKLPLIIYLILTWMILRDDI